MRTLLLVLGLAFAGSGSLVAGDLTIAPGNVTLAAPGSTQQILVLQTQNGRATADETATAKITSSDPTIVEVEAGGLLRARKSGKVTITASVRGQVATTTVTVSSSTATSAPSFRHQVVPTLTRTGCNSGACHGALAGKGGLKLSLRGFDPESDHFVLTRQLLGRRVDTGDPTDSLLLKKGARQMPHAGGMRFADDSVYYAVLRDWIASGAPAPQSNDPTLTKIDVFPRTALLKPKDGMRVVVRAHYSNGLIEDVTRWAKFSSSEEQVATINEDGQITVVGPGEAGVAVIFGTQVAMVTVTVPFDQTVDPAIYRSARIANPIDELVLKKLQLLNIAPSGECSDAEFIRRVSLDLCGVLPTAEEFASFLADKSADKRTKLVDRLLDRPEYVDYWSHKWSDLMLVSSRKLSSPAVWAFYRAIRRSVADNQPWDAFARDVLTATGSTLDQGGGNFFLIHKETPDLVESTAVTFLGTSITCARCHNHPLEKWTQDQYWGLANLFGRVGLKNGPRANEVIVQSLSEGEVLHPRKGTPIPPTPLDGAPLAADSATDRREYFARWLTAPENPFFARAVVNRVWRNFLGRGLVEAEDDLRETNPATNPELLAWLTSDFVAHRYDMRHLIRTIVLSATYQRSSNPLPLNKADDRYYSRYLVRRLSAEVILDAYSDLTGVATKFDQLSLGPTGGIGGANFPVGTRAMQLPDSQLVSAFLDAFGRAERIQTCSCETTTDASVRQALHLNNGKTLNEKLRDPNSRLSRWLAEGVNNEAIIERIFLHALSRRPTTDEMKRFLAVVQASSSESMTGRREALEDVCWAVLTGKEFLFNH